MPALACAFCWSLMVVAHGVLTAMLLVALGAQRLPAVMTGLTDFAALEALMVWTRFGDEPVVQKINSLRAPASPVLPQ